MPDQTGPTSEAGKFASSQNAFKHGMTSRQPLVAGESEADRNALHKQWNETFPTDNGYAADLVTRAANAEWLLRRVEHSYHQISARLFLTPMTEWNKDQHTEFQRITRYLTTSQRTLDRARTVILQHRREIRSEAREVRAVEAVTRRSQSIAGHARPINDPKPTLPTKSQGLPIPYPDSTFVPPVPARFAKVS